MRQASETALKLASLSVYNSILQQSVPNALYKLLWAACTNAKEFVIAWGNFVQVLAKESALDTSAQAMTQAIYIIKIRFLSRLQKVRICFLLV